MESDIPKTALVTGGSARIGASLCEGLGAAGYKVGVHYRGSSDDADALVDRITAAGGDAVALAADLTNMRETERLIPDLAASFGPVGLLINNASVFERDGLGNFDEALWDTHFDVHVKAPARLSGVFTDALPADARGLIVNIIDQRVWRMTPDFTSYTLSKAALWAATQTMAQALAPRIRVNAIGPGPTLPSLRQRQEDFDAQVTAVPLQRGPDLDEFTKTVLYLAQAKSVTGQMIALDGGQHLAWETPDQMISE
ncbi:MAG: SDR family oxidoreductase [Pseudomonadota bacterium]